MCPKRKGAIEILLKKGADTNLQNKDSLTPLHIASEKSHLDAVELLIKNGAKVPTTY